MTSMQAYDAVVTNSFNEKKYLQSCKFLDGSHQASLCVQKQPKKVCVDFHRVLHRQSGFKHMQSVL